MVKFTKKELEYIKDMSKFYEDTKGISDGERKNYTDITKKCSDMKVEIDLSEYVKGVVGTIDEYVKDLCIEHCPKGVKWEKVYNAVGTELYNGRYIL